MTSSECTRLAEQQPRLLVDTFEFGGWELHTFAGLRFVIVADGLGQDQDPYVFDSLIDTSGGREEMRIASIASGDVSNVFSTSKGPYERPNEWISPAILSDPIPTWRVQLRDGVEVTVAADGFRRINKWSEFFFLVEHNGRRWREPVLFLRTKDLTAATIVAVDHA